MPRNTLEGFFAAVRMERCPPCPAGVPSADAPSAGVPSVGAAMCAAAPHAARAAAPHAACTAGGASAFSPCAHIFLPDVPASVLCFDVVDSVLDRAHAVTLPPWGSVLARAQRAGRGQLRRTWHSPSGNVYGALRLPFTPRATVPSNAPTHMPPNAPTDMPPDAAVSPFAGTAAAPVVGALVVAALRELGLDVCLKWPNDVVLLVDGAPRKVGGILLEERNAQLWAGIGLNVAWAPDAAQLRAEHALPAACLDAYFSEQLQAIMRRMAHKGARCELLWCWLVRSVYFCYTKKLSVTGTWQALVNAHMLWRGAPVYLTEGNEQHSGIMQGIGPSGGVCLAHDGRVEEFLRGSIQPHWE